MIRLLLIIALATQTGALRTDAPLPTVSGIVVNVESGAPIPFALVRLGDARPYAQFRETVAGEDGRFQFEKVAPGDYFLGAALPPFAPGYYESSAPGQPGPPLQVKAGLSRSNLEIKLARGALISGRVVGPDGEPVPNATIMLSKNHGPVFGGSFTDGPNGPMQTNSSGEYRRFGLPPGDYTVAVDAAGQVLKLSGSDGPSVRYVTTYYPSALSREDAQHVTLAAGEQRNGIDIAQRLVRLRKLSGTLAMPASLPLADTRVTIRSKGGESTDAHTTPQQNGDFALEELAPGDYWVTAESGGAAWFGAAPVTIADRDVTGVFVTLEPTSSVVGRVIVDPAVAIRADAMRLNFALTPVGDGPRRDPRYVTTDANGLFMLTGLVPGPHSAFVSVTYPNGPNLVVISIDVAGRAAAANVLDVSAQGLADVVVRVGPKR